MPGYLRSALLWGPTREHNRFQAGDGWRFLGDLRRPLGTFGPGLGAMQVRVTRGEPFSTKEAFEWCPTGSSSPVLAHLHRGGQ